MKYLMLISLLLSSCSIVGPNQKAVHTLMGKPAGESTSGATLWIPFVYGNTKFDLSVQKHVVETTASSKDLQPIDSHIAVNWRIDPNNLTQFFKDVGDESDAVEKLIEPAVNEVFKASTAKLTAEEIVSRRTELKQEIDSSLRERLKRYGINIDDVSIVDVKFSEQFIQAIEAKQIAEQQKEQAHYLADKAKVDAEASVNQARGQAEAQKMQQQTLTPQILQKMWIEKWDGGVPTVMGSGGSNMLFNVPLPSNK